jgi:hypothetical protein
MSEPTQHQATAPANSIAARSQEQATALDAVLQEIASNLAKAGVALGAMPGASADKITRTEQVAAARSGKGIG